MGNEDATRHDGSGETPYACYVVEMAYASEAREKVDAFDSERLDIQLVHDGFVKALTVLRYSCGLDRPEEGAPGTMRWRLMARSFEEARTLAEASPLCHRGFVRLLGITRMTKEAMGREFSCPLPRPEPDNTFERVRDGMTKAEILALLEDTSELSDADRLLLNYALLMYLDRVAEASGKPERIEGSQHAWHAVARFAESWIQESRKLAEYEQSRRVVRELRATLDEFGFDVDDWERRLNPN